jgi:hypothetical protein
MGKPKNGHVTHRIEKYFGGKLVHSTKNPVQPKYIFVHNGKLIFQSSNYQETTVTTSLVLKKIV